MELLVLLSFALLQSASANLNSSELVDSYSALKRINHQNAPRSSDDEREHFRRFKANSDYIETHNQEAGARWTAGYNAFTTMTEEEKFAYTGLNVSRMLEVNRRQIPARMARRSVHLNKRNPTSVNYEDQMVPIKNQGLCGSCWTFSAAASLEYQINRERNGIGRRLSEQMFVNCFVPTSGVDADSCEGGWPADVWDWVRDNGQMVAYDTAIPYIGSDEECNTDVTNAIAGWSVWGANFVSPATDAGLEDAVATESIGVVSVGIAVVDSMFSYQSGVYDETECTEVNHAVNVVGYGEQDGEAFFRVRNTWGENWGDEGHVNMKRGVDGENLNTCQLSAHGHYPVVTGRDSEETEEQNSPEESAVVDWCLWVPFSLDGGYCSGTYRYSSFTVAIAQCEVRAECGGVTYEANTDSSTKYTLRTGTALIDSATFDMSWLPCTVLQETVCVWEELAETMLSEKLTERVYTVEEGKLACDADVSCEGISCKKDLCKLNAGLEQESKTRWTAYVLNCS